MAKKKENDWKIVGIGEPTISQTRNITDEELPMIEQWRRDSIYPKFYRCRTFIDWLDEEPDYDVPYRYIINKGATILFWDEDDEDDKTIVKLSKDDKFDKRLGFLTAYFQHHSKMSKTKANKYLDSLEVEEKK